MSHRALIGGTAREIAGGKTLIGGTGYEFSGGRTLIEGTGREIDFSNNKRAGDFKVGESLFLGKDYSFDEYLVVHQGLPSSLYDSSCNGTWALKVVPYDFISGAPYWGDSANYSTSKVHAFLTGRFPSEFSYMPPSAIKTVKIPYYNGSSVQSGANGLSTNFFLLSGNEVGFTGGQGAKGDGSRLSYFQEGVSDSANRLRKARVNGMDTYWWTRTCYSSYYVLCVNSSGYQSNLSIGQQGSTYIRPAIILDPNTEFDPETSRIIIA